ncbi:3-oxoacyl-[acyl-carrier-protein] synthase 3 [Weeksella virosa]|uniref:3-Oxoacyl-(Acyl-carrier-protein (ACP)) synthase III domain-containing protein n=1 Tax=Weeksella virosa (strain ATCC 43766 / DSM 16922 / JCM 21250 / CCUG 30538 / CDC 9751 / IAM 14551 / NBRC 16016 / NCTC 11634 / CL345/78) TaxID=865938 RepID=F0NZ37_WEEVC|nr:3-Oxoacyl-(acyl-carrier-protein (ACP)) synthase III domain-containing protein [Weeksella virosa DSM 16922]SUP54567.1 3-oxoacyl-[acyl-carrier-protein] synthase 3 [Weeksella virosa]VEH64109.1 3-oxoacyl-[acyl-carrier-protein] synthase 3 [Weeksella virosa]
MLNNVYITRSAKFLPNKAISNDEMEDYLGQINQLPSKARRVVLRNNGIIKRYYVVDKQQNIHYTNAELTAKAIGKLFDDQVVMQDVQVLSVGTSTPDQLLPSHASMVHGLLKNPSVELNSSSGICCSGMNALKFAYLSVLSGTAKNAVSSGSECVSPWMLSKRFDQEIENIKELDQQPIIAFRKEFLRWMLSDGAAAFLLQNKPNENAISLKIEWMQSYSYAHETEACMYAGAEKNEEGELVPWQNYSNEDWLKKSIFSIKQDVKVLDEFILVKGVESMLDALRKHQISVDDIDYFLPHISSMYFKDKLYDSFKNANFEIPFDKWFINLDKVGNVGAASIYLMVEELMNSGKLKIGDKILLSVPESGRFSYAYAYLTVV